MGAKDIPGARHQQKSKRLASRSAARPMPTKDLPPRHRLRPNPAPHPRQPMRKKELKLRLARLVMLGGVVTFAGALAGLILIG